MNWRSLKRALRRQLRPLRFKIHRWVDGFKEPDYPHGPTMFPKPEPADEPECPHTKVRAVRSNSGDGSPQYDFWTDVCEACGEEVGETQDD